MGVQFKILRLVYETPIPGAILLDTLFTTLSIGYNFDATIKSDNYTHGYISKHTGCFDTSVYTSRLCNCFALRQQLNGQILATDKGTWNAALIVFNVQILMRWINIPRSEHRYRGIVSSRSTWSWWGVKQRWIWSWRKRTFCISLI